MIAREIALTLPTRLAWQAQVVAEAKRFNVPVVGRRGGKTELCQDLIADVALDGYPVAWFAPTYRMLLDVWREVRDWLHPVTERISVQDRRIELFGGGLVEFWSLEHPDAVRGRRYRRVVIDEAAMIPDLRRIFNTVIRPTLADFRGDAWFPSTPRGLNDYWDFYRRGQSADPADAEWASWRFPTSVNPYIDPAEIAAALAQMTELEGAQEMLAEFVDLTGSVFRNVGELSVALPLQQGQPDRRYVAGVDLAATGDFTVVTVIDATETPRRQVYLDRFNGLPWGLQLDRIRAVVEAFAPDLVEVDRTGIGDMPFGELAESLPGVQVWGVAFNAGNKMSMVQALALGLEKRELELLADDTQAAELRAYEAMRKPSGVFSYGAPAGKHDDTVAALMLAYDGAIAVPWGVVDYG